MSYVKRKALSSQKRRGSHQVMEYGKRQKTAVGCRNQLSGAGQQRTSLEVPEPADWGDDSLYEGLDIDKLIESSQENSQASAPTNTTQILDSTAQVLNRTETILTGSPELFGDHSDSFPESITSSTPETCIPVDHGKIKHVSNDTAKFCPIATSTQGGRKFIHKENTLKPCHVAMNTNKQEWPSQIVRVAAIKNEGSGNAALLSNRSDQEVDEALRLEAEIWFQEIQADEKAKSGLRTVSEEGTATTSTGRTTCTNPETNVGKHGAKLSHQSTSSQTGGGLDVSLGSRLKKKLEKNAKASTPVGQRRRVAARRRASINQALQDIGTMDGGQDLLDIGPFYGLPIKVQELLTLHRGITKLYDWQHTCLTLPSIRAGKNLVYSLPTSGGKTLVAEILILQQILCHRKDAVLILPYVSIVQEKVSALSVLAVELGFLVEEYAGTKGAIPPRKRSKKNALFVCTIEKAQSLVNSLIVEKRISSLGLVVVDELHMIGDGSRRGACLESTLSKLKHLNLSQIIGMSATLSNIEDVCAYLEADVYTNQFRPVELTEYIKVGDGIYRINTEVLCPDDRFTHSRNVAFPYNSTMKKNDPDHLLGLALEVIPYNSCLIFCATKKNCQSVAQLICKYMPRNVSKAILAHKRQEKEDLILALRRECDDHLCPTLKRTVPYGVAYHHSGLTMDERKLIEEAYNDGVLCLLACTSTLAAGVNLPAKRVVLRSPYIARDLLTRSRYKQMVGRAGRAGLDSSGESILILHDKDRHQVADMLNSPLEGCHSSLLHDNGKGIRSLVLSSIALELTCLREEVHSFMLRTLLGVQSKETAVDVTSITDTTLDQLLDQRLIEVQQNDNEQLKCLFQVTNLGKAVFKGSIDIDQCGQLYSDLLEVCAQGMVLANTLHLLYLVTPYEQTETLSPNWLIFDRQFSTLGEAEMKVAELIGITEHFIKSKVTGNSSKKCTDHSERQANRFYLALMLWNILNRKSVWQVSDRFEVSRGFVQNLFTSSASFASSIQRFCEDLPQFWAIHQLLGKVTHDLSYCATADLLPLLQVSGVKQGRARQLVNAGYKTLRHLAFADADALVKEIENLPRRVAKEIISAAKLQLAERAEALREEAEEMMALPSPPNRIVTLGVPPTR